MKKTIIGGFTLIELLVVIAIIGILTAVILPNLNESRSKGAVAGFKASYDSLRKQAEIVYDNAGSSYIGMFTNALGAGIATSSVPDDSVRSILSDLESRASDHAIYGGISADGNSYAVYGRLPTTDPATLVAGDIWCADNQGNVGNPSADATTQFTTPVSQCW